MDPVKYLNETVWATIKPSWLGGIGVFAIRDIPKGTKITTHSIHTINEKKHLSKVFASDFEKIHPAVRELILDRMMFREGDVILTFYSPNYEVCLRSFMNHSNDPNSDGVTTLRDIKAGEEITEKYGSFYPLHPLSKEHYKNIL